MNPILNIFEDYTDLRLLIQALKLIEYKPLSSPITSTRWSPVNPKYLEDDSTDDEEEDTIPVIPVIEDIHQLAPAPDTPPSLEPSVLQNLDPSSSDRSPPSSLPDMEPTSDQIALLRTTTDDSDDTLIPHQIGDQVLDSPPFMEDLNQTVDSIEENYLRDRPDLEHRDTLQTVHDHDDEEQSSSPAQLAPDTEENTFNRPDSDQGAAALNPNLPGLNQDLEAVHYEAPVIHQDDFSFLYNFEYNQHRKPKRNDIIFYFDGNLRDWAEVRILSKTKHPNNYNI